MEELERSLKALANKRRLAILAHLKSNGEATVGETAAHIKLSVKATSKHLLILAAARILDKEQRSLLVHYSISTDQKPVAKRIIDLI